MAKYPRVIGFLTPYVEDTCGFECIGKWPIKLTAADSPTKAILCANQLARELVVVT